MLARSICPWFPGSVPSFPGSVWRLRSALVALLASGCAFITDAEHAARTDADGDGITWLEDCDDSTAADCATSVTTPTTVTTTTPADLDGDGHPATGTDADCDDTDPAVYPGAEELCDGVDNDCDGDTDEDATDAGVWYGDDDGDGFGSAEETTRACAEPSGYTADDTDCDDSSSEINPDAVESCNELDDDCDGETDEDDAEGVSTFYLDADSDGYGSAEFSYEACVAPTGYVVDETDCDDDSAAVNPGSSELCNGFDDDCDGEIDESSAFDALTWYADADGDSYGAATDTAQACEAPKGYTADSSDCDDTDASIHPGGDERCGGGDEDCDGVTDESDAVDVLTWIEDADGDGWGADGGSTMESCTQPSGAALVEGDCDDTDPLINPDAVEIWYDGTDADCDARSDYDADGDAWASSEYVAEVGAEGLLRAGDCDDTVSTTNPDAVEIWYDGTDADCDDGSDYDADGDGSDHEARGGDDCLEGTALDGDPNPAGIDPAQVYPGAFDQWYDGTDADCDDWSDNDADEDGYNHESAWGVDCYEGTARDSDENPAALDAAEINPGASEIWYDGTDADCDDGSDYDADRDGLDSMDSGGSDCDDADATVTEATDWYADSDGDGYGAGSATVACTQPSGSAAVDGDCDDTNAGTWPGAEEVWYDGVDADCASDDDYDADADGHPTETGGGTDCDDADPGVNPDAVEVWYDGVDSDCDGSSDYDADSDGWGSADYDAEVAAEGLDTGDCDDTDAAVSPGATEVWYDGTDADCDGASDHDADGDGYDHVSLGGDDCLEGTGLDLMTNPSGLEPADVNPGAAEVWYDGTDADCDDGSDYDADSDGYDHESAGGGDCYEGTALDRDENPAALDAAEINPGASEIWYDGTDADCDDGSDYDADRDGSDSDSYGGEDCDDADASLPPGCPIDLADADLSLVGDGLGVALAGVGDVSGDGLDDLLLGAATSDAAGTVAGAIYLVSGVSSVGSLADAVALFVGEADGDGAGVAVAGAGDADGDGLEDLLIGADGADSSRGRAYLILGGGLSGTMSLADADHALSGAVTGDLAGAALSGAGDVDGDGLDDLLVGAEGAALGSGTAYVVLGSSLSGAMSLSAADHTLVGNASDEAGAAVASAGDVDGDGLDDLLVGAPGNSLFVAGAGKVDLVLGASLAGSMFLTSADHSFSGEAVGDAVGGVLSPAGDVDDDGLADLLIGAPLSDDGGADAGKAAVILGVSLSGAVSLSAADHTLIGEATGDGAGSAVASVGDVDGDGTPDLLIGAPGADQGGTGAGDAGKIYLISGSALGGSASLADASVSFLGAADDELAGTSVTTAGDIDADGSADIAVGAEGSGTAYLLLGPW